MTWDDNAIVLLTPLHTPLLHPPAFVFLPPPLKYPSPRRTESHPQGPSAGIHTCLYTAHGLAGSSSK